jgi:hypothetical protein
MMNPAGTEFSGDKIVPHSDLRVGTASDSCSKHPEGAISRKKRLWEYLPA